MFRWDCVYVNTYCTQSDLANARLAGPWIPALDKHSGNTRQAKLANTANTHPTVSFYLLN